MAAQKKTTKLRILELDPSLGAFEGDLNARMERYKNKKKELLGKGKKLSDFANGHHHFGFHKTKTGWVYREWAPAAKALHLIGDFNDWNRESHPLTSKGDGTWEIEIKGVRTLKHLSRVKVAVTAQNGEVQDRIPLYATYVKQDKETNGFNALIWNPRTTFEWTDSKFRPQSNVPPMIYESHVGMATEQERVGTYLEFMTDMLPRIKADGYNTVQLMAIMEHPYYASFGYQVSNFFAASSWYGTPDELKALINEAHRLGISVLLDIVHSHAVKNTAEGINCFDGTEWQFFHGGAKGDHPAWGSKCFDYSRNGVLHFLLSNVKFWMEEYHFDGFRFDGVTSMLYHDHGLGTSFTGHEQYFSMNTDVDAVTYLMLASDLIHEYKKHAIAIAEDMSAMPGMCLPIKDGGMGFDYRLSMGLPDFFIKTIKEKEDGKWEISKLYWELIARRSGEKVVAYAESHDQALVGDKTIMFRLADKEMYWGMNRADENMIVERAVALHKMIRLVTIGAGGEGYLNFMGNEFGHPEWIDFPREGNGWSFKNARRLWSLADNGFLRYQQLGDFDKAMISVIKENEVLKGPWTNCRRQHEQDQILIYERANCLFVFNFHPTNSQTGLFVPVDGQYGDYKVILSTDDKQFGGYDRIDKTTVYHTWAHDPNLGDGFAMYLPARTAVVLKKIDPAAEEKAAEEAPKKVSAKKAAAKKPAAKKTPAKKAAAKKAEKTEA
ncbi:MAG: alpha amylase C-terminal domain-containing protein [Clostridia bacterium]|nr:alpha amylase C-terminal domain-containing protein [Clostridia bacterium]